MRQRGAAEHQRRCCRGRPGRRVWHMDVQWQISHSDSASWRVLQIIELSWALREGRMIAYSMDTQAERLATTGGPRLDHAISRCRGGRRWAVEYRSGTRALPWGHSGWLPGPAMRSMFSEVKNLRRNCSGGKSSWVGGVDCSIIWPFLAGSNTAHIVPIRSSQTWQGAGCGQSMGRGRTSTAHTWMMR